MGLTLTAAIDRVRIKARDTDKLLFTDDQLLLLANEILQEIYGILQAAESNLVYAEGTITTADGTMEYEPSFSFYGMMDDGIWLDGEDDFLAQIDEADKIAFNYASETSQPDYFYITEDGKVGFLPVPDAIYTVHAQYWKPLTELGDINENLPWSGIWDRFFVERLVVEMLGVQERSVAFPAAVLDDLYSKAMQKVYNRGCRQRRWKSNFFTGDSDGV